MVYQFDRDWILQLPYEHISVAVTSHMLKLGMLKPNEVYLINSVEDIFGGVKFEGHVEKALVN